MARLDTTLFAVLHLAGWRRLLIFFSSVNSLDIIVRKIAEQEASCLDLH